MTFGLNDLIMKKKSKDGTNRGNPSVYKFSNNDLTAANKKRQENANKYACDMHEIISQAFKDGCVSLTQIANRLEADGVLTSTGSKKWSAKTVKRIIDRIQNINGS